MVVGQAIAAVTLSLLGASGVAKVLDPNPTSGALRAAGLPSSSHLTRGLGIVEIVAAIGGLAIGGMVLVPAAVLYAGFALFTLAAVRGQIPLQSCGCFGREDTPPDTVHVIFNVIAAVALIWVAVAGATPIPWSAPLTELILYVVFVGLGGYASYLLLAVLPMTLKTMRTL